MKVLVTIIGTIEVSGIKPVNGCSAERSWEIAGDNLDLIRSTVELNQADFLNRADWQFEEV